jgi:hypothetical protein
MKTFLQFITEEGFGSLPPYRFTTDVHSHIKGWMSPKGIVHYFNAEEEHNRNVHPDLERKVASGSLVSASLKHGYARFGQDGNELYVHYNHKTKGGTQAALHALKELKPRPFNSIVITHKPWNHITQSNDDKSFTSPSEAIKHIHKMHPKSIHEKFDELHTEDEYNRQHSNWRKGWMSPHGTPYEFNADYEEHADKLHPDIADQVKKQTNHISNNNKKDQAIIKASQRLGYTRYGQYGHGHYLHFDYTAKGGTESALHALKYLHPHFNDTINVTHKPWGAKGNNEADFVSPGQAAAHIRSLQ